MAKNTAVFNRFFMGVCIFCASLIVLFSAPLINSGAGYFTAEAKNATPKKHKGAANGEWVNMPEGTKPAFTGVQGGTVPAVSSRTGAGNATKPDYAVNNFLQAIRGEEFFSMSTGLEFEGAKSASDNMASFDGGQRGRGKGVDISMDGLEKILTDDYTLSGMLDESELAKKI